MAGQSHCVRAPESREAAKSIVNKDDYDNLGAHSWTWPLTVQNAPDVARGAV